MKTNQNIYLILLIVFILIFMVWAYPRNSSREEGWISKWNELNT